ncbi:MAG: hypothetical protein ACM30I_14305 [Gemmatimonas sp.]
MTTPRLLWLVLIPLLSLAMATAAAAGSGWDAATESENGTPVRRFIPLQLWSGAAWDGALVVADHDVDRVEKPERNVAIRIRGPIASDKAAGPVYERDRNARQGRITQLFAINEARDGVAMVWQDRAGRITDGILTENKFPLGWWRAGETRSYDDRAHTSITIESLDFTYKGVPHSIKFLWRTTLSSDGVFHYIYSPGIGLAWSQQE